MKKKELENKHGIPPAVSDQEAADETVLASGKQNIVRHALIFGAALLVFASVAAAFVIFGQERLIKAEPAISLSEQPAVEIPAIELMDESVYGLSIPLFVYNQKIYTLGGTHIDPEAGKALLGEKLGTTKENLDEWSKKQDYNEAFASTIGIHDVYTVNGYSQDFRLMTYHEEDGEFKARFFERTTGIKVAAGKDVFGKLKMAGNVTGAKYQNYSKWNEGAGDYQQVADEDALEQFVDNLYRTEPFRQSTSTLPLNDRTMNDEGFREVIVHLKDGSNVELFALKSGYIYYNGIYFNMEKDQLMDFWKHLGQ